MFDLVNAVEAYPQFLPWCRDARVLDRQGDYVVAMLEVAAKGLRRSFTTRNRLSPGERIELQLIEGPFRRFSAHWQFRDVVASADREAGCLVSFEIDFALAGRLLELTLGPVLHGICDSLVETFKARAYEIYASAAG